MSNTRRTNKRRKPLDERIRAALAKKPTTAEINRRGLTSEQVQQMFGPRAVPPETRRKLNQKGGLKSRQPATVSRSRNQRPVTPPEPYIVPAASVLETPSWFNVKGTVDVSIIVPCFKSQNVIQEQIESWTFDNDGLTKEIIYVDDACPNDSKSAVLSAWEKRKDEISHPIGKIVYHHQNGGFSAACNQGAKHASGKYLIFLNADCTVSPNWIAPMVELLQSDEKIGLVGNMQLRGEENYLDSCGSQWIWGDNSFLHIGRNVHNTHKLKGGYLLADAPPDLLEPCEREMVTGCCFVISQELFADLNGFDLEYRVGYWEDADLCMRVRADGYKVMYQPNSRIWHKVGHTGAGGHAYRRHNQEFFRSRWIDTGRIDPMVEHVRQNPPSSSIRKHVSGKVVGCVIACNEEEFLEVSVDSVAPIVDEWIFVIGGNEYAYKAGMCDNVGRPNDNTLEIAHHLADKHKGIVIPPPGRLWKDKVEMRNQYARMLRPGNWMFMLDGDEVYKPNQLWRVQELMKKYECLIMQFWCFWNDINHVGIGKWDNFPQERVVRWGEGYGYTGKNHLHVGNGNNGLVCHSKPTWRNTTERMFYHYSWVRPIEKIQQKREYYKHQSGKNNDRYLEDIFLKWRQDPASVQGNTHPYGGGDIIEFPGTHPWGIQELIKKGKLDF